MDADSLTQILAGRHFNMPERIDRGIWPHPPLRFSDLVKHLAGVLTTREWFPEMFTPARSGDIVPDVVAVERRNSREYVVHMQSSGPSGFTVAGTASRSFRSPDEAAAFFLRVAFRLPGDLDGWKVIE